MSAPSDLTPAFLAHELRAPIALQRTLVEVALADPDADAATLRAMGERVLASCLRQQRLVDALLELARSGRAVARREPVDLAAAAAAALGAHDPVGLGSLVALVPAWTAGDPLLVERLAANLVSNAIRHNVAGGRIEVATRPEPGVAVLSVANTGPPVPAASVRRLFQPRPRLLCETGAAVRGTGLGLAVVHAVAAAHGARVTARPRAGGGLEVDVRFRATAVAVE